METMLLDWKTTHHGGDVYCVMCVLMLAKSLPSGSFLFLPECTCYAVCIFEFERILSRAKCLKCKISKILIIGEKIIKTALFLWAQICAHFFKLKTFNNFFLLTMFDS
jgi:hypothetical protein